MSTVSLVNGREIRCDEDAKVDIGNVFVHVNEKFMVFYNVYCTCAVMRELKKHK